jgi:hypothetical protein
MDANEGALDSVGSLGGGEPDVWGCKGIGRVMREGRYKVNTKMDIILSHR